MITSSKTIRLKLNVNTRIDDNPKLRIFEIPSSGVLSFFDLSPYKNPFMAKFFYFFLFCSFQLKQFLKLRLEFPQKVLFRISGWNISHLRNYGLYRNHQLQQWASRQACVFVSMCTFMYTYCIIQNCMFFSLSSDSFNRTLQLILEVAPAEQ